MLWLADNDSLDSDINATQFGFMPGRSTVDAIFILRQLQEKTLEGNEKEFWAFVDLEKAFDRVPRELIYWSLRKKGVTEGLINMVKAIYDGASTMVRSGGQCSEPFEVKVGVHQGSRLSPLLFITVLDAISNETRRGLPWDIMYADDLVITANTEEELQRRVLGWQECLESRGLKVNAGKTEVMVCAKQNETINVSDKHGSRLAQSIEFKYLGSTVETSGGCGREVALRVKAAWQKWKEITPVICERRMPIKLKTELYTTARRPL